MSGLETTEPRLGFCNIAGADGYPSWRLEKVLDLTNAFSRSIESFFSVSNEKVDGGEAVQKKRKEADLDGEVENEMKKITYYSYCIHSDHTVCFITVDFLYCV